MSVSMIQFTESLNRAKKWQKVGFTPPLPDWRPGARPPQAPYSRLSGPPTWASAHPSSLPTGLPGTPACRQQIVGLLDLRNHESISYDTSLYTCVSIKLVSIFLENPNTDLGTRTGVTGTILVSGHILDFQSGLPWYCRDEREQHLLKTSRVFWYLLFMGQKIEWWAPVREQSPCCDGLMN